MVRPAEDARLEEGPVEHELPRDGIRPGAGLLVLTLTGDQISAVTRVENRALPWFGLPRSLPD